MSVESLSEQPEPERQQSGRWQRFRQRLGFSAVEANQEEQGSMTTAIDDDLNDLRDKEGNFDPDKIKAALERRQEKIVMPFWWGPGGP